MTIKNCCAVSAVSGAQPRLTPSDDEHVLKKGQSLRLTCESSKPIEWKLPTLSHHLSFVHDLKSRTTITPSSGGSAGSGYRSVLEVRDLDFLDTGYFACHLKGSDTDDWRIPSAKTYVYVEDGEHLIVNPIGEDLVTVMVHQASKDIIPCKPTSPDVEISLHDQSGESIDASGGNEMWSYNVREGFSINEVPLDLSGMYTCTARLRHVEQSVGYYVDVHPASPGAPKPHINSTLAEQVALKENFQLNCSAAFEPGFKGDVKWFVPNPSGIDGNRISVGKLLQYTVTLSGIEQKVVHQVLYVKSATAEDQGRYECRSTDHSQKYESDSVFIKIHDANTAYAKILDEGLTDSLEDTANSTVKWVVQFAAYPTPKIAWFKNGDPNFWRKDPSKYEIKTDSKKTILEIKHATMSDSAVYRVRITASKEEDSRNFTLLIRDQPSVTVVGGLTQVVRLNDRFEVRFRIMAYPEMDSKKVHVYFQECSPTQRNCDLEKSSSVWNQAAGYVFSNRTNEELVTNTTIDFQTSKLVVSGVAKAAGRYWCKACNHLGCNHDDLESSVRILVTELSPTALNGAELTRSSGALDPVEGEAFRITCSVSLYNFSSPVSWRFINSSGHSMPISLSQLPAGAKLLYPERKYTYVEELAWSNIRKTDSGQYNCDAKTINGTWIQQTIKINVQDARKPKVLNSSQAEISVQQFTELELFCKVDGMPVPAVKWFKGEEEIKNGVSTTEAGSKFTIHHTQLEDAGSFRCVAENMVGDANQEFVVDVIMASSPAHKGIIAGIVIVVVIVVVLLGILARKIHQDKKRKEFFRANQLDIFDKGNPESINPDLPIDEQTELLPYDKRWEFPRDRLKLGKQLGAGAFGRVLKGEAVGIDPAEPITTVAVKMVRSHGNMIGLKALMSELKIMIHMGSHLNVVNLLGACTKHVTKGELMVIVEFCRFGNLQNFLIRHRSSFINQVDRNGLIDAKIGAERLAAAEAQRNQQVPMSPLGNVPTFDYSGGVTADTDATFLSMSPTGGTGQPDLIDMTDSSGRPQLMSVPSISSSGGPTSPTSPTYPPWRSNYRGDYRDLPDKPICTRDLLCWAFQIACGMSYLARRKILHGDLAARNVLLADDNIVKIADFGLAREVYRSGKYKKKGEGPLPVKWMAIESIIDRVFSTQSDVWSFGIVLWELFSLGKTPYPGMEADEEFFRKLGQGYRMDKPKYATNRVYEVMKHCWAQDPIDRPGFDALSEMLGGQLDESVRRHYMDLNEAYVQANGRRVAEDSPDYLAMMSSVDYVNVGARPSLMPNRQTYVNIPPNGEDGENRQADYLVMEGSKNRDSTAPPAAGAGYLFMTSPPPTTKPTEPGSDASGTHFDFKFAPNSRSKAADEKVLDSVEMRPMLSPSPASSPSHQQQPQQAAPNGFSNPNYQNPPSFAAPVAVKCSDLDDPAPQPPPHSYVNLVRPKAEKAEEQHYVTPKNNSTVFV